MLLGEETSKNRQKHMFINPYLTKKERVILLYLGCIPGFFGFFLNPEEIGPSWSGTNLRTDVLVNDVQVHGKVPVSFENANKAEESEDEEEIYSRSNVA